METRMTIFLFLVHGQKFNPAIGLILIVGQNQTAGSHGPGGAVKEVEVNSKQCHCEGHTLGLIKL